MRVNLEDSIDRVRGIGPFLLDRFNRLGIETVRDLLYYFPRDYEDRRSVKKLSGVLPETKATFRFKVLSVESFFYNGREHPKIKVTDGTGIAYLYCFNRPYLAQTLGEGREFYLTGKYTTRYNYPVFSSFDYSFSGPEETLKILPIYRLTEGLSQRVMRRIMDYVLRLVRNDIPEEIPDVIIKGYRFKPRGYLLSQIHFPATMRLLRYSMEAISYQEFLKYQMVINLLKTRSKNVVKERAPLRGELKEKLLSTLGFKLTNAQLRVINEIEADLMGTSPMNRLIQGDVGSGKTIVALVAATHAIDRGGQVAFMAPTEILARQHYENIKKLMGSIGINAGFLSGGVKGKQREKLLEDLASGRIDILVGTHALFSLDVIFKELSLVVIDEQQKFGVVQRGLLREKGENPDCIVMSATPIPRTLAMTIYGDLDVSVIDEMPPKRGEVETHIVKQAKIDDVYQLVRREVAAGHQVYFVYPMIDENSELDIKSATDGFIKLSKDIFPEFKVALLHGRMGDDEKNRIMLDFKAGKYQILVATTVLEVGIDIPNATVMVIEQAERFGLSTIHQLRGRIGRGSNKSYCILVPDKSTAREQFGRLMILKKTSDGFKIAEWDLKLRGPGELMGKKQSGVPSFIIKDMDINAKLIYRAQKDAKRFIMGELCPDEERDSYLEKFVNSEEYRRAKIYYGG